mgnify:FL=1
MKRTIIRSCVCVVTFVAALIVSSMLLNRGNTDMTADMEPPRLPSVYVDAGGLRVNMMDGYLGEMEEEYMRGRLLPIGADRKISIGILTYGTQVDALAFEVRSADGTRLVEDTQVSAITEEDGVLKADIVLKDLIDEETEYCVIFKLTLEDEREVSYYMRVIQQESSGMQEKLDFVASFSEDTFDDASCAALAVYMETDSSEDNSTLSRVTIHSSLDQLGWGSLDVRRETEPVFTIMDMTGQTASIQVEYLVSYTRYEREVHAFVKEVYRIRTGPERMYLLDYERTMSEYFSEDASSFVDEEVVLGIRNTDVEMAESEGGNIVAFAQNGVLYSLNVTENRIARLFSFHDADNLDERAFPDDRNFKILQVDEAGNVFFMVYGYISSGRRQGYCGAQLYFYDGSANTVEELAFIPSGKSPEILKAQIDQLAYINGKYELYLFLNDQICCVHLDSQTVDITAENLSMDSCSVSESNRMIAWQSGERYASESLILMNLSTGEQTRIEAGSGNYILPLGFMGEDIVYGIARQADITRDDTGAMVFPMYQVKIQDESGELLMTYEKEGYYVTGCEMSGNQIILSRVERDAQGDYVTAEDDQIVSSQTEAKRTNTIITVPTENDDRLTEIQLRSGIKTGQLKVLTPGEVLYEGSRQVDLPPSQETVELYYVYSPDGEVTFAATPREAIERAEESSGSVTARGGFYIWRAERLHTSNQIMAIEGTAADEERSSLEVCLDVILTYEGVTRNTGYLLEQGKTVAEILQENLENVQVLELTGCSLSSVLYYPDREIPVLALMEDGNAVLITGFNERNVVLMDPQTGQVSRMGLNDATAWFEENGNMFVSYVEMQ